MKLRKKARHPLQPLVTTKSGIVRFKSNAIVCFLLDHGKFNMNDLAVMKFTAEDREQFAQLIGYSLSGFEELSYVTNKTYEASCRLPIYGKQDELTPEAKVCDCSLYENQVCDICQGVTSAQAVDVRLTPETPKRIQRKRTKGWGMPPNTVSACRPGLLGNPFKVDADHDAAWAVDMHRRWLSGERGTGGGGIRRIAVLHRLSTLRGMDMACFCGLDQPCHVDFLLEIANAK